MSLLVLFSGSISWTVSGPKEILLLHDSFGALDWLELGVVLVLGGGVTKPTCSFFGLLSRSLAALAAFFNDLGSGLRPRGADFPRTRCVGTVELAMVNPTYIDLTADGWGLEIHS